jgi:hypothetical protein
MVHNIQNYWVFGLHLSSGILETRKDSVSEIGCFRPQVKGEDIYCFQFRKRRVF